MGCIPSAFLQTTSIKLDLLLFLVNASPLLFGTHALANHLLPFSNLSSPSLLFLPLSGAFNIDSVCESCQLGKSKKLLFPASTSTTLKPLELVHTDVWGPTPISSIRGFRFYVILIDYFSRYCWIYPLCHKSDVYNVFVFFKVNVENFLDNKIKILCSVGGGEFISHQFEDFSLLMESRIKSLGHTHPNKMAWLRENSAILSET